MSLGGCMFYLIASTYLDLGFTVWNNRLLATMMSESHSYVFMTLLPWTSPPEFTCGLLCQQRCHEVWCIGVTRGHGKQHPSRFLFLCSMKLLTLLCTRKIFVWRFTGVQLEWRLHNSTISQSLKNLWWRIASVDNCLKNGNMQLSLQFLQEKA